MSRNTGTFNFAANFEPLVEAPLDARMRVSNTTDLITATTWNNSGTIFLFNGLLVSVVDDPTPSNIGLWFLADKDNYHLISSWVHIGQTGSIDASGTSSVTFQLNNGNFGVMLSDTSGNLTVNTYDGSLATVTTGGVYINGFEGALGFEASINGNGVAYDFNINHNIGNKRHLVSMWDGNTDYAVYPQIKRDSSTDVITFTEAPQFSDWYSVIIVGF
jgi:hypothetical protein